MEILETIKSDLYLSNNFEQKLSEYVDYKDKVCVKPWGHEFLIYESTKLGTWFLKINKNVGTSTHTHFKKDTIMIIVSGKIRLNMVNTYEVYGEGSVIFIPKRKFHGLNSLTDFSYVIEIEIFDNDVNFSDKNDLLRLVDNYKRDNTGYAKSVEIVNENIKHIYDYFYLNDKLNCKFENTTIEFGNLKKLYDNTLFKTSNNMIKEIFILYETSLTINNKIISPGSFFTYDEINKLNYDSTINNKFLKISFNGILQNKVVTDDDELNLLVSKFKHDNKKIVLTCGCFDILHVGHIKLLEESKKMGDILIVLLSSDEQINTLKGNQRPINNLNDRLNLFKIIPYIDYIVPYNEILTNKNEEILDKYINIIKPDIWTKGDDYTIENILTLHPSLKKIALINLLAGKSTTNIVNKIINN